MAPDVLPSATPTASGVVLHVGGPLLAGICIYVCFRSTATGLFAWIAWAGLSDLAFALRGLAEPVQPYLPGWVVHSLPDGLWAYAATALARLLLKDPVAVGVGLAAACGIEVMQWSGYMTGTADAVDVLLCCAGCLAAVWLPTEIVMKSVLRQISLVGCFAVLVLAVIGSGLVAPELEVLSHNLTSKVVKNDDNEDDWAYVYTVQLRNKGQAGRVRAKGRITTPQGQFYRDQVVAFATDETKTIRFVYTEPEFVLEFFNAEKASRYEFSYDVLP